jgi:hypothetical protein
MRLPIVEHGHRLPQKLTLLLIRIVSRDPAQPADIVRTMLYRPEYFGKQASALMQTTMRGPSNWSVGERELFAAFTSSLNDCKF